MNIKIEKIKNIAADVLLAISSLSLQLNPNSLSLNEQNLKSIVNNPTVFIFVAKDDEQIVGMVSLFIINGFSCRKGLMEDLVVDLKYRRLGIAKKLINAVIDQGRKENLKYVDFTSSPIRIEANKLYSSLGFEKRDTNVYRVEL